MFTGIMWRGSGRLSPALLVQVHSLVLEALREVFCADAVWGWRCEDQWPSVGPPQQSLQPPVALLRPGVQRHTAPLSL